MSVFLLLIKLFIQASSSSHHEESLAGPCTLAKPPSRARYGKRAIVVPTAKTAKKSAIPSVFHSQQPQITATATMTHYAIRHK